MAFPVTLNGRTYTLTDFEGTNYVDGLPDAFEDFVTHAGDIYNSTSTTSNSIGTGSKTFTVEANKPYQAGTPLRIADAAAPSTNFLDTVVTSYSGTTLVVNSIGFGGSGTKTSWTVNIGGAKTVDGTLGLSQGGTGATDAAGARTNIDVYSKTEADTRYLNISGDSADISFGANMSFGDNNKAIFGAGSDLQIYHDAGGDSYITESNASGQLRIQAGNIKIADADGNNFIYMTDLGTGGLVNLMHNGSSKLATATSGVTITGNASASDEFRLNNQSYSRVAQKDSAGSFAGGYNLYLDGTTPKHDSTGSIAGYYYRSNGTATFYANTSSAADTDARERMSVSNAGVVINDISHSTTDFRVESDSNANMLFVDAGENAVKIGGTTTREGALQIFTNAGGVAMEIESTNAGSGQGPILQLRRTSSSPAGNDYLGGLNFVGQDSGNNALSYVDMYTRATTVTDGSEESQFSIRTRRNGNLEERVTIDAVETTFNQVGGNVDFRVESDANTHMLFVDAGDDKIGIQTSTPTRTVDIEGPLENDGTMYTNFRLGTDDAKVGQRGAGISFGGNYRTSGNTPQTIGHIAGINGVFENGTDANYASALQFYTRKNGGSLLRQMVIGSSATVINEGGSDYDFRVESNSQSFAFFVDAGSSATTLTNAGGFKARFESNGDGQRIVTSNAGHTIGMVSGASYALNTNNTFIKLTGGGGVVRITANNNGVNLNNNATSFSSASDIRLKNITGTFTNAIEDVKTLEPVKFTWKHDTENTPNVGFTAQSVQPVLPEAVDSNDIFDDGAEYLSVRYTEVIPLLTAALQEAITKIETLEARITALESS